MQKKSKNFWNPEVNELKFEIYIYQDEHDKPQDWIPKIKKFISCKKNL